MRTATKWFFYILFFTLIILLSLFFIPNNNTSFADESIVFDSSELVFLDKNVTYNGENQSLTLSGNIPSYIQVEYNNNNHTNAGKYMVNATIFTTDDSVEIVGRTSFNAYLNINKADIDISGMEFLSKEVVFDRNEHNITAKNIPNNLTLDYETETGYTYANVYVVTAKMVYDNDNYQLTNNGFLVESDFISAVLTIKKAESIINIAKEEYNFVYDGTVKRVDFSILGEPKENVIFYQNDKIVSNSFLEVGTYKLTLKSIGNNNYTASNPQYVTLNIKLGSIVNANRSLTKNEISGKILNENGFYTNSELFISRVGEKDFFEKTTYKQLSLGTYKIEVMNEDIQGLSTVIMDCPYSKNPKVLIYNGSEVKEVQAQYNKNGQLVFVTDTLGYFMVVTDTNMFIPIAILSGILFLLIVVCVVKKFIF